LGIPITPMKLVKLVYIAHGWHLALHKEGKPLFNEPVEAWKYGPVVSQVYHKFKFYGTSPVTEPVFLFLENYPEIHEKDSELAGFLDDTWDRYENFNAVELANLTHLAGTPWAETIKRYEGKQIPRNLPIPNDLIRKYYLSLAKDGNAVTEPG